MRRIKLVIAAMVVMVAAFAAFAGPAMAQTLTGTGRGFSTLNGTLTGLNGFSTLNGIGSGFVGFGGLGGLF